MTLADTCGMVLDRTEPLQRLLNKNPRRLAVATHRVPVTVAQRRVLTDEGDVVELTLAHADGRALPRWHPGAHVDVYLPSGRRRQYSLCGDPRDGAYRIAVRMIVDGGGGSAEMHGLPTGSRFDIGLPRNAFYFGVPGMGSDSTRVQFIAAGIGITPILPMVQLAQRCGVDWRLLYIGRHRGSLPYVDELASYGPRVVVRTTASGRPTTTELLAGVDASTAVYACGPDGLIAAIRAGLAPGSKTELHCERFAPAPVVAGTAFEITLARSGETVTVAADETALHAVRRVRPTVPYSCQQGFCGTCTQRVLAGGIDGRGVDVGSQEHMLVCVERASGSSITLDL